jgi:hypothetical protein
MKNSWITLVLLATGFTQALCGSNARANDFDTFWLTGEIRTKVSQILSQSLPENAYFLEVKLTLDEKALAVPSTEIKLPLGSGTVSNQVFELSADAMKEYQKLFSAMDTLEIHLGVDETIPPAVLDRIQKNLISEMRLTRFGEKAIQFEKLPATYFSYRKSELKSHDNSLYGYLGAFLGVGLLFLAAVLLFGLRRHAQKMSSALAQVQGGSMETSREPQSVAASPIPAGQFAGFEKSTLDPVLWGRAGEKIISTFFWDCLASSEYHSIPGKVITRLSSDELAQALKSRFPKRLFVLPGSRDCTLVEVESLFETQLRRYSECAEDPLSYLLLGYSTEEVLQVMDWVEADQMARILYFLTPIKQKAVLSRLTTPIKLKAWFTRNEMPTEMEKAALIKKIQANFQPQAFYALSSEPVAIDVQNWFSAASFEEDEWFSRNLPLEKYRSAIHALAKENGFLETFSAHIIGDAFFGYSTEIQQKVLAQLEGKKQEWVSAYFKQNQKKGISFQSPEVKLAQHKICGMLDENVTQLKNAA